MCLRTLIALTTSAALLLAGAPAAHANGDPPSNVLLNAAIYVPATDSSPPSTRLVSTVDQAGKAGYDIKVALLQSPRDLGNIPQFWGQPQAYADHLASGLRFAWRGDLLVVMPQGVGVAAGADVAEKKKAVAKLKPRGEGISALATVGDRAVRALATAAGRPIGGAGGSSLPALLVLGALLLVGGGAAAWRVRMGSSGTSGLRVPNRPEGHADP